MQHDTNPLPDVNELAGGALRTFFNISDAWKLNNEQRMKLLGLSSESTFYKWKKDPSSAKLSPDALERLSYVFGIFKDLETLLPESSAADTWVHQPNNAPLFNGQAAIERMTSGHVADLYEVRRYLDAQRGG